MNTDVLEHFEAAEPTFVTPTLLARLPPRGAFLVFPVAGALWRRFLPRMSCASCSFLRFWRPSQCALVAKMYAVFAPSLTSLDDVVERNGLLLAVCHCDKSYVEKRNAVMISKMQMVSARLRGVTGATSKGAWW